jgi:uncharacterized membrane protein (DUF4010 family)
MEKTLLQKAQVAVAELNGASLLMNKQMETGELDNSVVAKAVGAAMRTRSTVRTWRRRVIGCRRSSARSSKFRERFKSA